MQLTEMSCRPSVAPVSFPLCGIALFFILVFWMIPGSPVNAAEMSVPNPGTDLWRDVRQRSADDMPAATPGIDLWKEMQLRYEGQTPLTGTTQVAGVESGHLINSIGDQWRRFRMEMLVPFGGYVLMGMLAFVVLFYLIRGRVPIQAGASDKVLFRYSLYERTIHWTIASTFLLQAFTGLIMMFGRSYLIPVIGHEGFSTLASLSIDLHNILGPVFLFALVLVFIKFLRRNIYQKGDLTWLLRGGGVIGKKHVPSNFFNMGEKSMFWLLVFVGGTIAISGLIMLFPSFGQGRVIMGLSHVAHGITAVAMTAVVIGHIYIGTVGMEGALEGMKTGYCDLHWAREHHDWWAQRCEDDGKAIHRKDIPSAGSKKASPGLTTGQTAENTAE
ncbi:MAG: formate dehydrogenase subunit gamma [Gammaproteobacteria bacterium]|nr:formate dehydrogenase subunit gamma [Gammaproteobacteria bacterium]